MAITLNIHKVTGLTVKTSKVRGHDGLSDYWKTQIDGTRTNGEDVDITFFWKDHGDPNRAEKPVVEVIEDAS
jgi:hypothetical protein